MATKTNDSVITDCDFTARTYILKLKRSAWTKYRTRPIVYSPVTNLRNGSDKIVVRRLCEQDNGQDIFGQDVCLIDRRDIEPDSSKIYMREGLSQEPMKQTSHGVVLNDSDGNGSKFCRGDRLWLMVDAATGVYTTDIPVINLRTSETGTVKIADVCWFPAARAEDGRLLTFGGASQELRFGFKTLYKSWAISQAADSEKVTCKMVDLDEKIRLTDVECKKLFAEKLQFLEARISATQPAKDLLAIAFPRLPQSLARTTALALNQDLDVVKAATATTQGEEYPRFSRNSGKEAIQRAVFLLKHGEDQTLKPPTSETPSDTRNSSRESPMDNLRDDLNIRTVSGERDLEKESSEKGKQKHAESMTHDSIPESFETPRGQVRDQTPITNEHEIPPLDLSIPDTQGNPYVVGSVYTNLTESWDETEGLWGPPFDYVSQPEDLKQNDFFEDANHHWDAKGKTYPYIHQPNIWAGHFHVHAAAGNCSLEAPHQHCVREIFQAGNLGDCLVKTDPVVDISIRQKHVCCRSDEEGNWLDDMSLLEQMNQAVNGPGENLDEDGTRWMQESLENGWMFDEDMQL